jgi:DNA-binding CsgD family transcriptional regulator
MEAMGTDLIGREAELGSVAAFLDRPRSGPAALVLSGAPGIGKTTIWRSSLEMADERGVRVLVARPGESEARLAFAGLIDLLELVPPAALAALPAAQTAALEIALRRAPPGRVRVDTLSTSLATLAAIRELAAHGPILIAIDDIHWLDRATARALEFTVRRLTTEQVGILVSLRATEGARLPDIARALPGDVVEQLEVGPLPLGALEQLLRARLGVGFLRPTLVRIEQASGGNPFFALEIGRALLRRGIRFAPESLPIPASLTDIVRDRLASLNPAATDAVLVAAALSAPTRQLVNAAVDPALRDADGLAHAVQAGVLVNDGERLRFSHPLLASVAYEMAGPAVRRGVHARLAHVLSEPEERSRHLALASERASERVARALDEGARQARDRGATEAAAQLSELACHRTPANRPDDARRRTIQTAEYLIRAGDPGAARRCLEPALAKTPAGPARAELLVQLAESHSAGDWDAKVGLLEEAAREAGESVSRIAAERLLGGAAIVTFRDLEGALSHARTALHLAAARGDPAEEALCLTMVARLELLLGNTVDPGLFQRAIELEPALAWHHIISRPRYTVARECWVPGGRFTEARGQLESLRAEALRIGDWDALPMILADLADIDLRAGAWHDSLQLANSAVQASNQVGQPGLSAYALNRLALVLAHLGRVTEARAAAQAALVASRDVPATANWIWAELALGFVHLSMGDALGAAERMLPPIERLRDAGWRHPDGLRAVADAIEALMLLGRLDEAEALLHWFDRDEVRRPDRASSAALLERCRGLLLAAAGDADAAAGVLEAAVELHTRVPDLFAHARTLLVLGEAQRRARRIGAARRSLDAALTVFEDLGARLWAERARQARSRVGGRQPARGPTETQRRIIELVAAGRTNREVADALFMSPHTVDSHLRQIYRERGVRSRTELARQVAAGGTKLDADD